MTATFKHVANQYILIVDERPDIGDWFYVYGSIYKVIDEFLDKDDKYYNDCFKIIAAEDLDGVKGIALIVDDTLITDKELVHDLLDEVSFKEVEVTEHEEYWLVRL